MPPTTAEPTAAATPTAPALGTEAPPRPAGTTVPTGPAAPDETPPAVAPPPGADADGLRLLPGVVRRLWSWSNAAVFTLFGIVLTGLASGAVWRLASSGAGALTAAGGFALTAATVAAGTWWGRARYDRWSWRLDGDLIEASWGVWWQRRRLVPRHRVQTITSETGPIDRRLGLRSVTVHTAGLATPNLTLPHLTEAEAEWVRLELAGGGR